MRRVLQRLSKKGAAGIAAHEAGKKLNFEEEIKAVEDVWNIKFGNHPITKKMDFHTDKTEAAPMFNILDLEGNVINPDMLPDIDKDLAVKMMTTMVRHNMTDRILLEAQRQGRISFYMTSFGEEAAVVGSAAALQPQDYCFLQYREAALLQYRGMKIEEMIAQCMGNSEDPFKGRQMPIHYGSKPFNVQMVSSPLATQIPQAAGAGYAFKLEKDSRRICACYFGEGAASEGDFHAGLNFASTTGAHTLFFVRNNGYAISTPTDNQYFGDGILPRGIAYGMPSARVDGNDVLAVYSVTKRARELILERGVPALVESMSYRVGHHSTSDDSTRYREKSEISHFDETFNPILRFANYLKAKGWWHDDLTKGIQTETRDLILSELKRQEKLPIWPVEELFNDTFAVPTPNLVEQRAETVAHYEANKDKYASLH